MWVLLFILIPLIAGLATMMLPSKMASWFSMIASVVTLLIALLAFQSYDAAVVANGHSFIAEWIPQIGAYFSLEISSGVSMLMVLLTGIAFPIIFLANFNKPMEKSSTFYGLMLLSQAGLMGVFLAKDALLFYVFWEVALIPVYFLSSMYGGEKKIAATFKFFVYTFVGSLLMLVSLLYIYYQAPVHSFSWESFVSVGKGLSATTQAWLFAAMFIAFAIKMPIFPFHTWQPDAYEQSATPVTMVMSAIMVKMGLFAVLRWLLPVLPEACHAHINLVLILSIIGILYASCLAMVQTNIKRLIAYSSIAHVGLMCAALFSHQIMGAQGAGIQMFNHGINITGLWILVSILEHRLGTQDLREMGGIAKIAPAFTIALVLISLANIALPLTNGFVGEFIMFNGLFNADTQYNVIFTVLAALGVILAAVYTLRMIQKIAYGELNTKTSNFKDLSMNEWAALVVIGAIILLLGFYPDAIMHLVRTGTN